jgi:hypothetical protein
MSNFDAGVSYYDTGVVSIPIHFPEGERACKWCRFCKRDNDIRYRCILTDRILFTVNRIPEECPIEFKEDKHVI